MTFRGDNRHPIKDKVFESGFQPRFPDQPHYVEGFKPNPNSRICFTYKPDVAALFPLEEYQMGTWVYVLHIPKTDDYDEYTPKLLTHVKTSEDFTNYLSFYYASEANVKVVPTQNILGAFFCERYYLGKNYLDGGIYRFVSYIENYRCTLQTAEKDKILSTVTQTMDQWRSLAIPFDGLKDIPRQSLIQTILEHQLSLSKFDMFSMMLLQQYSAAEERNKKLVAEMPKSKVERKSDGMENKLAKDKAESARAVRKLFANNNPAKIAEGAAKISKEYLSQFPEAKETVEYLENLKKDNAKMKSLLVFAVANHPDKFDLVEHALDPVANQKITNEVTQRILPLLYSTNDPVIAICVILEFFGDEQNQFAKENRAHEAPEGFKYNYDFFKHLCEECLDPFILRTDPKYTNELKVTDAGLYKKQPPEPVQTQEITASVDLNKLTA